MAVIFTDGFDYYNGTGNSLTAPGLSSRWLLTGFNTAFIDMTAGRFGGQGVLFSSNEPTLRIIGDLGANYTQGAAGFAFYPRYSQSATGYSMFGVTTGNTTTINGQFNIRYGIGNNIEIYRGGTLLAASAAGVISVGVWNYVEVEYVISDTVGRITVYLNNNPTPIVSVSGVDTQNLASPTFSQVILNQAVEPSSGLNPNTTYDDFYVTDTPTRLGEQRVITSYVNGDSSTDFWSSSTGGAAPYTMLDEATCDGDTTYASSSTFNSRIVLTVPALPVPPTTVNAVNIVGFARKDETQFRQVALEYQNTAGAVSTGSTYTLNGSYTYMNNLMPQNPLTAAPWTAAEVNSMKIGARVVS